MRMSLFAGVVCSLMAGCSDKDGAGDSQASGDAGGSGGGGSASGWVVSAHPCAGNRTDALWMDDADRGFVGCGTTTKGLGLFQTTDGGATWSAASSDPAGVFDSFRVMHLVRAGDGKLYVSGTSTANSARVVSTTGAAGGTLSLDAVFDAGSKTWNSFSVGSFARTDAGFAIAESATGTGIVYRSGDTGEWRDGSGWWSDYTSFGFQVLDMVEDDGSIYGCGSTISQPPVVFVPGKGEGIAWQAVQLAEGAGEYNGELWDIDASGGKLVVGGVNQDRDVGMVYVSGSNPADPSDWAAVDASSWWADDATWIRGVCRTASTILAVGELSARSQGLLLRSDDGGATWSNQTDVLTKAAKAAGLSALPPLHRCQITDGGRVVVAGADGLFARLDP